MKTTHCAVHHTWAIAISCAVLCFEVHLQTLSARDRDGDGDGGPDEQGDPLIRMAVAAGEQESSRSAEQQSSRGEA